MFNETFVTAVISTAHIRPVTAEVIAIATRNDTMPWWIINLEFGYSVRVDGLADVCGQWSDMSDSERAIMSCPDMVAATSLAADNGIAALVFDSDAEIIPELTDYADEWDAAAKKESDALISKAREVLSGLPLVSACASCHESADRYTDGLCAACHNDRMWHRGL